MGTSKISILERTGYIANLKFYHKHKYNTEISLRTSFQGVIDILEIHFCSAFLLKRVIIWSLKQWFLFWIKLNCRLTLQMQVNIFISLYISRTTTVLLSKNHCTLTSLRILDFVQCYYLTNEWMMEVRFCFLLCKNSLQVGVAKTNYVVVLFQSNEQLCCESTLRLLL